MAQATLLTAIFGTGRIARVRLDAMTHTLQTMSYEHHEIHAGSSFMSDFVDSDMADDETIILAFKTPPGKKLIHMLVEASTLVGGDVALWEGPSWTVETGTLNPIVNRNRDGTPNSSILLEDQATSSHRQFHQCVYNVRPRSSLLYVPQ